MTGIACCLSSSAGKRQGGKRPCASNQHSGANRLHAACMHCLFFARALLDSDRQPCWGHQAGEGRSAPLPESLARASGLLRDRPLDPHLAILAVVLHRARIPAAGAKGRRANRAAKEGADTRKLSRRFPQVTWCCRPLLSSSNGTSLFSPVLARRVKVPHLLAAVAGGPDLLVAVGAGVPGLGRAEGQRAQPRFKGGALSGEHKRSC